MKINHFIPALAAVLGLALASAPVTVKAQTATNATAAAAPSTATKTSTKTTEYAGSITAISETSLTVQTKKAALTLAITADTKFATITHKKKTPAQASDFAVGDKVTGSYTKGADGSLTAFSVHKKVTAASAAAAAAAPLMTGTTPATH